MNSDLDTPLPPQVWPKRCETCGRLHTAEEWAQLALIGHVDRGDFRLELRNCECGSTGAVPSPEP